MTKEEYFIKVRDAFYTLNDLKKYNMPKEVYNNICTQFYTLGASYNEQSSLPYNLNEASEEYALDIKAKPFGNLVKEAFKAGVQWQKEQMMKDAVEAEVYWDGDFLAIDLNMAALGYSERDKVRIIIVKED